MQLTNRIEPTIQICSHSQAADTAKHTRKHARTDWCLRLIHNGRGGSQESQLLLPPAEESASSHVSTFRSASDKAEVGLSKCVIPQLLADPSQRSIFTAEDWSQYVSPPALASLIFQSVFALLRRLGLRTSTSWFISTNCNTSSQTKRRRGHITSENNGVSASRHMIPTRVATPLLMG